MSITVTLNEIGGNTSPYDGLCIGEYVTWNLEFTNTASWLGKTIYFNPALFIELGTVTPDTNILPAYGFTVDLPSSAPNTGDMAILTGPFTPTEQNLTCEYDLVNANELRINLSFILTADLNRFISGVTAPSVDRFSKNIQSASNTYQNADPSVYNENRLMRGHLVVGDPVSGMVESNTFADFTIRARFYDSGLTAGSSGEFTDWTFTLSRSGNTVANLSAYDDTTVTVQVDISGAGTIGANAQILVFKETGAINSSNFITDLSAGIHINTIVIEGIDYITAFTPPALVGGSIYEFDFTIDSSKIENGATYRIVPIIFDATANLANSATTPGIVADALPDPVSGTITGTISDYNDIFTGDCLQAALVERLKACVSLDKASYNAAVIAGDFDTNFFSYQVQVLTTFGGQTVVLEFNDKQDVEELEIVDAFDAYNACLTFRIRPEWAGLLLQVNHIFTFNVPLNGNPYTDVITYRQVVNANQLEEEQTTPFITSMALFDGSSNPVTEICEDFVGPLRVEVTKTATVDDYNLIAHIAKGSGQGLIDLQEQEDYTNNILDQSDSTIIDTVDVQFVANVASFTIEQELLDLNQDYRVYATAKKVNLTPPVACPVIEMFTQTQVGSVVPSGSDLVVTLNNSFQINNYAPDVVTNVDIYTKTQQPKTAGVNQYNNFVLDNGVWNYLITFAGGFTGVPVICQMDIAVTLASGCTYTYTVRHEIIPQLNRITQVTEDVTAD